MAKFDSTVTSLFEMWTPAWSSASTNRSLLRYFFSFLERMVLFLSSLGLFFFSSFFIKEFLPLLIFPWAKIFP